MGASVFFYLAAFKVKIDKDGSLLKRRMMFVVLGTFALIAFGEEISWGQNIFKMQTPGFLKEINAQKEINIHNLKIFYYRDENGEVKTGWRRALTEKSLFTYLWIFYCVVVPFLYNLFKPIRYQIEKVFIPVVPLWISLLFIIDYEVKKKIPHVRVLQCQNNVEEIFECVIAFLLMVAAWYFSRNSAGENNIHRGSSS